MQAEQVTENAAEQLIDFYFFLWSFLKWYFLFKAVAAAASKRE